MKPAMLERAIAAGRAPAMAEIMRRGDYVPRVRRLVPLGHPRVRGDDHHRASAPTATGSRR